MFSKTQVAAFATATEGTMEILPRNAAGYLDWTAERTTVAGIVITGHRNALAGLRSKGLVRNDTAGASNVGMLTEAGIAHLPR